MREVSDHISELRHGQVLVRAPFSIDPPHYNLSAVEEEASRAGLKPGDLITRINDQPVDFTGTDLWAPLRAARAGDRLAVEATRVVNGRPSVVGASIVLQPLRAGDPSAVEVTRFAVNGLLTPLVCTALGFWVAAARIRDTRAWLLLFVLLGVVEFTSGNIRSLFGRADFFQPVDVAYHTLLANLLPTAMLLFAIYFPDRLHIDRRAPWLKWLVIAPVAVTVICETVIFQYVARRSPEAALRLHTSIDPIGPFIRATYPLFIVGFFAIMVHRTFTERAPDARRRLLLFDAGAGVSLVPVLIFLAFFFAGRRDIFDRSIAIPIVGLLFAGVSLLFPLTVAYVIVVRRAMDVRVVVRQGVQYVLARGGIRVIQLALMVGVGIAASSLLSGGAGILRVAIVVAGLVAIVAISGRFADRLRAWVDRRFFREAYNAELVLSDLAMQVRTMVETRPLLQTVAERVAETLHVPRVAILLNEGGRLQPAYSVGYAGVPDVAIPRRGRHDAAAAARPARARPLRRSRFMGARTCPSRSGHRSRRCSRT